MPTITRAKVIEYAILIGAGLAFVWLLNVSEPFYPAAWLAMNDWVVPALLVLITAEQLLPKRLPWTRPALRWVTHAVFLMGVVWPFARYGLSGLLMAIPDEAIRTGTRLLGQTTIYLTPWFGVYMLWRIGRALERLANKR